MEDKNWADDKKCSFSTFSKIPCGFSNNFPYQNDIIKIAICNRDINSHLKSVNLRQSSIQSEGHLLCYRVGVFSLLKNYSVCPNHRSVYGIRWRRGTTCTFPGHKGKSKPDRSVYPLLSWHILSTYGCLLPVGSAICRNCRGKVEISDAEQEEWSCLNSTKDTFTAPTETDYESSLNKHSTCSSTSTIPDSDIHSSNILSETCSPILKRKRYEEDDQMTIFSWQTDSLPSSQISSWSDSVEVSLNNVNEAIGILSNGQISPLKFQVKKNIESLQPSTRRLIKRKALASVDSLLNGIAPGQSQALFDMLHTQTETNICKSAKEDTSLKKIVAKAYQETTDRSIKKQLLSIIADTYTKKELCSLIPTLTIYSIDEARKHAKDNGSGLQVTTLPPCHRQKMDKKKLDHAIDFFFNSSFHEVSSYGTKEMKLDDGTIVTIPEVVRSACHSTLINIYQKFSADTNFVPLSRSTLFKILSVCHASQRTNLRGLDNTAADGVSSYENLLQVLTDIEPYTVDDSKLIEIKELRDSVINSKIYMKTDYKIQLNMSSHCPDHCIAFSLSDGSSVAYRKACEDHNHGMICERCNLLPHCILDMKELVNNLDIPHEELEDFLAIIDTAEEKILEWKSHLVRSVNQDLARSSLLSNLASGEAVIIMDWAMKFLPIAYREKQSDWFAQKGINWHVSVCIYKDSEGMLRQRTYTHTMDATKQDWLAVATIVQHTLMTVASGADILSAADMKQAIDDHGGITGCQSAHVEIQSTSSSFGNRSIKGISKISNVLFNDDYSITVWRAYEIGRGIEISLPTQINHFEYKIVVHQDFVIPNSPDGNIKSPTGHDVCEDNFSLNCPENGCVSTFHSYFEMQNHCLLGRHNVKKVFSTYDDIKLRWKDACLNLSSDVLKSRYESSIKEGDSMVMMGWALKKEKKSVRFSDQVKSYLSGIFEAGEISGKKSNPSTVAQNMRVARLADGSKMFKPHEYLEVGQIASYFSRLSCLKKCGRRNNVINVEDSDLEAIIHAINTDEAKELL